MRRLALAAFVVVLGVGCPEVEPPPPGVGGLDGVLAFEAPTELVFGESLAVGSTFAVTARPLQAGAVTFTDDADVGVSSQAATVTVTERSASALTFVVVLSAPGDVRLAVSSAGEVVDRVDLRAVAPVSTTLIDRTLLPYAEVVDATLPASFSFLSERPLLLEVAAVDRCGNGVLDLGASRVVIDEDRGVDVAVSEGGGIEVSSAEPTSSSFDLTLETPGLAPLVYRARVLDPSAVDELRVNVAAADGAEGTFRAWARPFADGAEVVGVEDMTWVGNARITLNVSVGPLVDGVVDAAPSDDPARPRDATLTAATLGEEGRVDLLALASDALVARRADPPARANEDGADDGADEPVDAGSLSCASCGGASVCDPLAALAPVWALRRWRRRR
jgi:hypothetical protein